MGLIDEKFVIGQSVIHKIDPRIKVVCATMYSMVTAVLYRFESLMGSLILSILLVLIAKLSMKDVGKRLLVLSGFLILIWIMVPVTFEGETLFKWGPLNFMKPGILLSAQITMKSISILMVLMVLIATMSPATLGHALHRLYIPEKIVHLFLFTYRYIFVIEQEYHRILRAIKIRNFKAGTNMHTYQTIAYILGMLFVRATARAERIQHAMRCRGFRGKFYSLQEFPSHGGNWIFMTLMIVAIFLIVIIEWRNGLF